MPTTLIIPDLHNKWWIAKRVVESIGHDQRCYLGDYWDDFVETDDDVDSMSEHVATEADNDNVILCLGNHDLPYSYHSRFTDLGCGWTSNKHDIINRHMQGKWDKLKFHAFIDGWLLSHAGFSPALIGTDPLGAVAEIEVEQHALRTALEAGTYHPWLAVSTFRGGGSHYGGPFWQDFREMRIIAGLNQCVGHTPMGPVSLNKGGAKTVLLDSHARHYGLLKDGDLTVHTVPAAWLRHPDKDNGSTKRPKNRIRP